jgi:hypothetical protein
METALTMPGQPVRRGTMAHEHDAYAILADVAARQRDATALQQYAPRIEALAERDNHRLYRAVALRALGVASRLDGELSASQRRLETARDQFAALGARWQMGHTLLELAEGARAQTDSAQVRALLAEALNLFQIMGAEPDAERTRDMLAALN